MRALIIVGLLALVGCDGSDPEPVDVDAALTLDASELDPCAACGDTQVCVQRFDGTCNEQLICVDPGDLECAANTCSAECQALLCPDPYQCENRPLCGDEVPGAFTCYGP